MRRARALGGVVLLLALSCGRNRATHPVDVTFWQRWPVEAIQPLVQRFEAENPSIHVVVRQLPAEGVTDSLAQAAQAGPVPDLVALDADETARFIDQGWLSDWSAGVADLKPAMRGWELCSLGDAIYGLPWLLGTRVLLFNRELFARAGVDSSRAPETWDELKEAAAKVQKLGHGGHGFAIPAGRGERFAAFMPFAWGNGGELLSARLDSCRLDSPANTQALEYLVSLTPVSLVAEHDSIVKEFTRGRVGAVIEDAGFSVALRRSSPRFPQGIGPFPAPAADHGTHASAGTGTVLASFTRSRRKEDALKLARYLAERQNTLALASALGSVFPPHPDVAGAPEYRDRPDARLFLRQLETTRFEPIVRARDQMLAIVDSLVGEALAHRMAPGVAVELADSLVRKLGVAR